MFKNVIVLAYECPFQSDSLLIQALLPNLVAQKGSSYTLIFSPKKSSNFDTIVIDNWVKSLPNVKFEFVFRRNIILDFLIMLIRAIKYSLSKNNHFYSRGYLPGLIAYIINLLFKRKYIFDPRGILAEEFSEDSHGYSKYYISIINYIEKRLIVNASINIFVSKKMLDFYEHKHSIFINNFEIRYNTPDVNNFHLPKDKTINNLIKFVYVGSTVKYQRIEDIFMLISSLKNINFILDFYVPQNDANKVKDLANLYNVSCELFHLKNYEISDKLSDYHYGFLLRENTDVNLVSSPIKFGEYIASGVKVITTDFVGDYSSFVRLFNVGLIIDLNNIHISSKQLLDDIAKYNYSEFPFKQCLTKLSEIECK